VGSWIESGRSAETEARLALQLGLRGHPKDLVIVEAQLSLVLDRLWLDDLRQNLCHGSPVRVSGARLFNGSFAVTWLQLIR
jgi:hypothetical protein